MWRDSTANNKGTITTIQNHHPAIYEQIKSRLTNGARLEIAAAKIEGEG